MIEYLKFYAVSSIKQLYICVGPRVCHHLLRQKYWRTEEGIFSHLQFLICSCFDLFDPSFLIFFYFKWKEEVSILISRQFFYHSFSYFLIFLLNSRELKLTWVFETEKLDFRFFYFHFWAMLFNLNDYDVCIQYHLLTNFGLFCLYFWVYFSHFLLLLDDWGKTRHLDYFSYYHPSLPKRHISFDLSSSSSFFTFYS